MGTRADFYVGKGKDAEWIGSIAFDGYRIDEATQEEFDRLSSRGIITKDTAYCWNIKSAKTEEEFRAAVNALFDVNDDSTRPEQGWPWPWQDSRTTDYAYCFTDGRCQTFHWGGKRDADPPEWPDMTDKKNVTLGKRSGMLVGFR